MICRIHKYIKYLIFVYQTCNIYTFKKNVKCSEIIEKKKMVMKKKMMNEEE